VVVVEDQAGDVPDGCISSGGDEVDHFGWTIGTTCGAVRCKLLQACVLALLFG
jgi:hypothetical protein